MSVACFYCDDDQLAELLLQIHGLGDGQKERVFALVSELSA